MFVLKCWTRKTKCVQQMVPFVGVTYFFLGLQQIAGVFRILRGFKPDRGSAVLALVVIKLNHQKHSNGHCGREARDLPCVMRRASRARSDGMAGHATGTTALHGRLLPSDFQYYTHPSKARVAAVL
jgi:hypothetical protein